MTIVNSNQAEALNQIRAKGQSVLDALDEILRDHLVEVTPELEAIRAEQAEVISKLENALGLEPVLTESERKNLCAPGADHDGVDGGSGSGGGNVSGDSGEVC